MGIQVQTLYKKAVPQEGTAHSHSYGDLKLGEPASLMTRQFISFSFQPLNEPKAKNIEDFNFVIVSDGSGISKSIYSTFEDTSKTYAEINGQQWYATRYNANALELKLGTDGVSDNELTDFIRWFKPGREGWLILSEHSNRKILARVAEAPNMEMTPYEKELNIKIDGKRIKTSTTEYKGFITINFVMDYPFWQAIESSFDLSKEGLDLPLTYKVIYEDGIPVISESKEDDGSDGKVFSIAGGKTAKILSDGSCAIIEKENGVELGGPTGGYNLYYAGTAPSYPVISFDIPFDNGSNSTENDDDAMNDEITDKDIILDSLDNYFENDYIKIVNNNYTVQKFSYIKIGSQELRFTLPGYLASYNEAVKILKSQTDPSYVTLLENIKENITDSYLCSSIIGMIEDKRKEGSLVYNSEIGSGIIKKLKMTVVKNYSFSIDCSNGCCKVSFDIISSDGSKATVTEYCGDMLMSNCVCIDDRSGLTDGRITDDNLIEVNASIKLKNFKINYNYMYL